MSVYGLCADLHCHDWSAFAAIDSEGRNTRLMLILNELERAALEVKRAGGDLLVIAGDLFHVRGSVDPEVFNPVRDRLRDIKDMGVRVIGIPGNHDLAGKDATKLRSAVQMLHEQNAVDFTHTTTFLRDLCLIPWQRDIPALLDRIGHVRECYEVENMDLVIHRGIDGTLTHMPPTGFTAEKLAEFGFRRVWAGDYHHAKSFGNGVFSIGALTQQTWSHVGTKAGFWIVDDDKETWFASRAPNFLDLADLEGSDWDEIALEVDGHYVRAKLGETDAKTVAETRQKLLDCGAKGVLIQAIPATVGEKREGVSVKSLATLDKSVLDYVAEKKLNARVVEVCGEIIREVLA